LEIQLFKSRTKNKEQGTKNQEQNEKPNSALWVTSRLLKKPNLLKKSFTVFPLAGNGYMFSCCSQIRIIGRFSSLDSNALNFSWVNTRERIFLSIYRFVFLLNQNSTFKFFRHCGKSLYPVGFDTSSDSTEKLHYVAGSALCCARNDGYCKELCHVICVRDARETG